MLQSELLAFSSVCLAGLGVILLLITIRLCRMVNALLETQTTNLMLSPRADLTGPR